MSHNNVAQWVQCWPDFHMNIPPVAQQSGRFSERDVPGTKITDRPSSDLASDLVSSVVSSVVSSGFSDRTDREEAAPHLRLLGHGRLLQPAHGVPQVPGELRLLHCPRYRCVSNRKEVDTDTGSDSGFSVLLKDTWTRAGIEPTTPRSKDGPANNWPTVTLNNDFITLLHCTFLQGNYIFD